MERTDLWKLVLLFAIATLVYEIFPRLLPQDGGTVFDGSVVVFLQGHLSDPWLDWLFFVIYSAGYPLIVYGTAAYLLWKREFHECERYIKIFIVVQALGVLTWWLFPVIPPRMGVGEVRDIRAELGGFTESFNPYPYGAFPSLHVANALVGVFMLSPYGGRIRKTWVLLFVLLSFSTLYLGEHYWQDVVGGLFYGYAGCVLVAVAETVVRKRGTRDKARAVLRPWIART